MLEFLRKLLTSPAGLEQVVKLKTNREFFFQNLILFKTKVPIYPFNTFTMI
jgi:hypothetical protein